MIEEQKPKQGLIPLSEIAELTPYSEGYLILLARRGKLKTVKHQDEWYTTLEWLDDYLNWLNERIESAREHSTTIADEPTAASAPVVPASITAEAEPIQSSELRGSSCETPVIAPAPAVAQGLLRYDHRKIEMQHQRHFDPIAVSVNSVHILCCFGR